MRKGRRCFYSIFLLTLTFSAVYLALRRGAGLEGFVFDGGANVFGDFINNLHYPTHEGGPYFDSCWASFPPLAYTFYYLLNVCFTRAKFAYELMAYAVITAGTCMVILFAVRRIFDRRCRQGFAPSEPLTLSLCLLLSGVMIYAIERGNSVLNVLAMLLLAFELRDSDTPVKREAALLLIAVAAGFKGYPAVFGLLYILEKRWKETLRLLVYGVVLFFVPFLWFGGVAGFKQFLQNQAEIHAVMNSSYFTSIPSISSFLAEEFGWSTTVMLPLGKGLSAVFGVLLLVCVFLDHRLWMRVLLLVSLFIVVPGWSAEYMAIYMALPLVLCYCDGSGERWHTLYMALFGCVFVLLPFGSSLAAHAALSWNTLISFAGIYGISVVGIIDTLTTRFGRSRVNA